MRVSKESLSRSFFVFQSIKHRSLIFAKFQFLSKRVRNKQNIGK